MPATTNATLFDTLTPAQGEVLKALVEGATITAAAQRGGVHRSTVHLWTHNHPAFARALLTARQDRAERLNDDLADLRQLACDTFRQLLTDPNTPAATRLRAAMEIVKLVESQRPTQLVYLKAASVGEDHRVVDTPIREPQNPITNEFIKNKLFASRVPPLSAILSVDFAAPHPVCHDTRKLDSRAAPQPRGSIAGL